MNQVMLSFIVPVYGVEPFLRECLDSLFSQNISPEAYEVICVDDGSPDRCGEILDEYALRHKNMTVIHQQNAGVSAARNRGLDAAKGEYIWFVDSDDFIAADILEDIVKVLSYRNCDQLSILPFLFKDGDPYNCFSDVSPEKYSKKVENYLITRLLKRESIESIGLRFNPKITYQEDNVFYTTLFPHLQKKERLDQRIVYFYRERQGSLSRGGVNTERIITSLIEGALDMKHLYETDGDNYNGYSYLLYMFMTMVMQTISAMPAEACKKYLAELKEKGLFPLKYSLTYTVRNRKDADRFLKRIKKRFYSLCYTWFGFYCLRFLKKIKVFEVHK